jgi:hypothetical protein
VEVFLHFQLQEEGKKESDGIPQQQRLIRKIKKNKYERSFDC